LAPTDYRQRGRSCDRYMGPTAATCLETRWPPGFLHGGPAPSRYSRGPGGRLRNVSTAGVSQRSQERRTPTMRCLLIVRHGRPGGAEQPVLAPSLLRCNSFAFRARSGRAHFYNPNHDRRRPTARRQTSLDAEGPGTRRVSTAGEYWVCPQFGDDPMGSLELCNGGFSAALRRRPSSRLTRACSNGMVRLPRVRDHVRRHSRPRTHHHPAMARLPRRYQGRRCARLNHPEGRQSPLMVVDR
jgi:hypothetical protein